MSQPNPKAELYDYMMDSVEEYCESTGEPQDAPYFREMIKCPEKRNGSLWECFEEWIEESLNQ